MVWCSACVKNVEGTSDAGRLWCSGCGKVSEDHILSEEPTFVKNAAGQSQLAGRYVRSKESEISASRARILENGGWWSGVPTLSYNNQLLSKVDEKFPKHTDLIVACQKGLRSIAACEVLYNAGYRNLFWV